MSASYSKRSAQPPSARLIAGSMAGVPRESIDRQLGHFEKAAPAYSKGVREALKS